MFVVPIHERGLHDRLSIGVLDEVDVWLDYVGVKKAVDGSSGCSDGIVPEFLLEFLGCDIGIRYDANLGM
jgi:hypothetical protein